MQESEDKKAEVEDSKSPTVRSPDLKEQAEFFRQLVKAEPQEAFERPLPGWKKYLYLSLLFAKDAYGVTPMTGHSLENIVKPLGSGGSTDPLNQRATSGWTAFTQAIILNDAFMIRLESAASL